MRIVQGFGRFNPGKNEPGIVCRRQKDSQTLHAFFQYN
jgi:hypothetical protein